MVGVSWASVLASPEAFWNKRDFGGFVDRDRACPLWDVFFSCPDVRLYNNARRLLVRQNQYERTRIPNRPNRPNPPPLPRPIYRSLARRAFTALGLTPEDVKGYLSDPNYSHTDKPQQDLPVVGDEGDKENASSQAQSGASKKKIVSLASKSTSIGNTKKHATKYKILPSTRVGNTKEHDTQGKSTRNTKGSTKNCGTGCNILPVVPEKGTREYEPCMDAFRSKSNRKRPRLDMPVVEDDIDTSDLAGCFRMLTRGI